MTLVEVVQVIVGVVGISATIASAVPRVRRAIVNWVRAQVEGAPAFHDLQDKVTQHVNDVFRHPERDDEED